MKCARSRIAGTDSGPCHLSPTLRATSRLPATAALAEVNPQLPAVDDLLLEMLLRSLRRRNVDEVGVGETSRLAAAAVDGYTYVEDIADFAEEV